MRIAVSLGALALATNCAGTTHEVVPTGKGTFMVASHGTMGWSSAGAQKAKALEDANNYCKNQGKEVETISDRETDSGFGKIASAEVEVRCVAPAGK